ncbi:MAG: hypothetical protein JWM99_5120 [Verrucomicrobiales bacterium]|nr:hypothetical protein [Verrucomicrobiales bacterium]
MVYTLLIGEWIRIYRAVATLPLSTLVSNKVFWTLLMKFGPIPAALESAVGVEQSVNVHEIIYNRSAPGSRRTTKQQKE